MTDTGTTTTTAPNLSTVTTQKESTAMNINITIQGVNDKVNGNCNEITDKSNNTDAKKNKNKSKKTKHINSKNDREGRCHYYNEGKKRHCRQAISQRIPQFILDRVKEERSDGKIDFQPIYCGNHASMYETNLNSIDFREGRKRKLDSITGTVTCTKIETRKRIPCPIDPSHTIYECNLKAHLLKCPKARMQREDRLRVYYQHDINVGGHGMTTMCLPATTTDSTANNKSEFQRNRSIDPQSLALQILRAYLSIFPNSSSDSSSENTSSSIPSRDVICQLSFEDLYQRIPIENHGTSSESTSKNTSTKSADPLSESTGIDTSTKANIDIKSIIANHRVKIGGTKHLQQIESIVGHIRNAGAHKCTGTIRSDNDGKANNEDYYDAGLLNESDTILEMGAGRATTGFVVASVCANIRSKSISNRSIGSTGKSNHKKGVKLVVVERGGSRSKADGAFRRKGGNSDHQSQQGRDQKQAEDALMSNAVNQVDVRRIKCDLAHVNIPRALEDAGVRLSSNNDVPFSTEGISNNSVEKSNTLLVSSEQQRPPKQKSDILVIAKHLCGAGTDLALKSIHPIRHRVNGCVMATCCHSLCDWSMYVGRDTLIDLMASVSVHVPNKEEEENQNETMHIVPIPFGEEAFNIMKRWACGTVLFNSNSNDESTSSPGEDIDNEHTMSAGKDGDGNGNGNVLDDDYNISKLCKVMGLKCGPQGLGRACQRLIDYGRCEYMRTQLFSLNMNQNHQSAEVKVKLCHYVDRDVTPQNALLFASYT